MQAFGYTAETMQFMLQPLVTELRDPLGSMGNDSALAVMSDKPRMLYDYFKQLFAQVTNPAIDSIREEVIMALECYVGPEGNLLAATEAHAQRLALPHPDPLQRGTRRHRRDRLPGLAFAHHRHHVPARFRARRACSPPSTASVPRRRVPSKTASN